MAKDAYYFSHDANALADPKILSMRCDYGMEGYGIYWGIVEMMRSQQDYRLERNKNTYRAMKIQFATSVDVESFINDCIYEYGLFICDDDSFWSDSLLRRMEYFDDVRTKRSEAGRKGGKKSAEVRNSSKIEANVEQTLSNTQAIVNDFQAKKEKESKEKEIKENINIVDDAVAFYQSNIGIISPIILQEIDEWSTALDDDSVKLAITIAAGNNSRKWSYVKAILSDWYEKGARRLEDCQALQLDHKRKQQKKNYKPTSAKPKIEVVESTTTVSDDEYQELLKKYGLG